MSMNTLPVSETAFCDNQSRIDCVIEEITASKYGRDLFYTQQSHFLIQTNDYTVGFHIFFSFMTHFVARQFIFTQKCEFIYCVLLYPIFWRKEGSPNESYSNYDVFQAALIDTKLYKLFLI